MTELFLRLFNLSATAGWIVLAVLLLRPLLKKAPKWISCLLWCIVALRLLLPFSPESVVSLIPSPEVIPSDIAVSGTPAIHSAIPVVNSAVNPLFTRLSAVGVNLPELILPAASAVWAAGASVLLIYSVITWLRLRYQVRVSIRYRENIYFCDDIGSPFILGILRPRIYVPSGIQREQLQYVLAHESAHLHRRDHWWKPLGFLLLTVYWFNPLLWVAYVLLCKDIEQACDEKVVSQLDMTGKKAYSRALLACSARRRLIMACPVAFGEVSVKTRIRDVLRYKKPQVWIVLGSVLLCVLSAVCFLTDPVPCAHEYESVITRNATCTRKGEQTFTCALCRHSYTSFTDKLSHSYDPGTRTVVPTCTREGTMVYTCTGCGREKRHSIAMAEHIPGETVLVQAPTCAQPGKQEARCIGCDQVCQTHTLPVTQEHILVEKLLREATCAAPGEGIMECSRCNYSHSVEYAQLKHTYEDEIIRVATCSNAGEKWRICTGCGDRQWYSIPATEEHRYVVRNLYGPEECYYCRKAKPESNNSRENDLPEPYSPKDAYGDVMNLPVIDIFP